ncbi:MAG TPA: TetR/AcrR family transcriptional regulator [Streptosporangiaceae bacterium]
MSPTPAERRAATGRYHHGDLRTALTDAAAELVAERGVRGFSLAEVSRRLGVSPRAPYRHFADREALLATVVVRAYTELAAMLPAGTADDPGERLAAIAGAYVRFAAERRALFEAVFAASVDKARFPEIAAAAEPVDTAVRRCVQELCPGDPAAAAALEDAVTAGAHGHATLLLDGAYGTGPAAARRAARKAAGAARALVIGRAALAE